MEPIMLSVETENLLDVLKDFDVYKDILQGKYPLFLESLKKSLPTKFTKEKILAFGDNISDQCFRFYPNGICYSTYSFQPNMDYEAKTMEFVGIYQWGWMEIDLDCYSYSNQKEENFKIIFKKTLSSFFKKENYYERKDTRESYVLNE